MLHFNNSFICIIAYVLVITLPLTSPAQPPPNENSLLSVMNRAFIQNPKTQSIELRLQAMMDELSATQINAYAPKLSLSHKIYLDRTQEGNDVSQTKSKSGEVVVSLNLFKGWADYYNIKAKSCNFEKQKAFYNSTDARAQNTRGSISGLVANYYLQVVNGRLQMERNRLMLKILQILAPYAQKASDKSKIENWTRDNQSSIADWETQLRIAANNYKYVVNEELPARLDSFEEIQSELVIPKTYEQAFLLAEEKSPEILTAKLARECERLNYQKEKADLYGFRVDLTLSAGRNNYQGNSFDPYTQRNRGVYLSISKSFGAGDIKSLSAEEKMVRVSEKDLEGVLADTRVSLQNNYIEVERSERVVEEKKLDVQRAKQKLDELIQEIINGKETNLDGVFDQLGEYSGQLRSQIQEGKSFVQLKFNIQSDIGTLFDQVQVTVVKNVQWMMQQQKSNQQ